MNKQSRQAAGWLLGAALAAAPLMGAQAETFRWATGTDPSTMDPYARNAAPVLSFLNNVYEGLVRRGKDMSLEPSLATSWEPVEGGWRFHLRQGVTFQGGQTFDAEDVMFSLERSRSDTSSVRSFHATVTGAEMVDQYTVDIFTSAPAIYVEGIANWLMMDKEWATEHGTLTPGGDGENFANRNANGTGPFQVSERDPGVRTVLVPHAGWWDEATHNLTEAVYTPITTQATRLAALLSGEVDFIEPIPPQDVDRVAKADGFTVQEAPEARVIFLGFSHKADELNNSNLSGVNPFKDAKVREAVYSAINVEPIISKVMRGHATPAGLLIDPTIRGFNATLNERGAYDVEKAKGLLTEAGYPDGFSFGLSCPNDRYINDEAICTAVASMLAQAGLEVNLRAVPVAKYFGGEGLLRKGEFDMYLLGWSPGTFDAEHPIRFLLASPDSGLGGSWNFGAFTSERVNELLPQIQVERDETARQGMVDEVNGIMRDEVAYVPLHVQPLLWATKDNIELSQRADNFLILRWVNVN